MVRRHRPMVPAPENTPMPDKQKDLEAASRLYSLYMRPWTLDHEQANSEVLHVTNLNQIPNKPTTGSGGSTLLSDAHEGGATEASPSKRRRITSKQGDDAMPPQVRSYAAAWSWYVRGNIVSEHAARLIKQFMAACCGKQASMTTMMKMRNPIKNKKHAGQQPTLRTSPCYPRPHVRRKQRRAQGSARSSFAKE